MKKIATRSTISVIVPTLNEADNVGPLLERLDRSLALAAIEYEVIIIDDRSTDSTVAVATRLGRRYPVRVFTKQGSAGKAYSLLEGFSQARYDLIAFIDADLQYPPEALPAMVESVYAGDDIVVARRVVQETSRIRSLASRIFLFVFARGLHGLNCDVQSGLKVFRKKIINEVKLHPTPWTFDLEFLLQARHYGYQIGSVDITFGSRHAGESKIDLVRSIFEIGINAVKLRFVNHPPLHLAPTTNHSMLGAGIAHRTNRYVTHTTLSHDSTAIQTFVAWQIWTALACLTAIVVGLFISPIMTGVVVIAILSLLYFIDVIFNLYIVIRSLNHAPEITVSPERLESITDRQLPIYSILCPLYREAAVLPTFLASLDQLDWPKNKLDVVLLFEEDDRETQDALTSLTLPTYVRVVIVPPSLPKTKPKAANYGLGFARGEYIVIYDAEDIPDPLQLKKAWAAFQTVPRSVICLQAKLNYFNPRQNLLTRLFTAEYSLWFDVTLVGLQAVNSYIPLGGTSNHFRADDLKQLEGWDPFNVTEDCDLGIRLFRNKFQTAIIDSTTMEEANSDLKNWLRQRSRWIKGYMQTYLVHMRQPVQFVREHGRHAFIFQLVVGGKIAFALINPILWITTIAYFVFRSTLGPVIETLFPGPVFVIAASSLIFGNFLFLYYFMIGCAKRDYWWLMKYIYLAPVYWLMTSIAAYIAAYQLIVKPHFWEKTHHGLHERPVKPVVGGQLFDQLVSGSAAMGPQLMPRSRRLQWRDRILSPHSMLIGAMLLANVMNLFFNAMLGRVLSFEAFGLVTLINTLWYMLAVGVNAFATTVNHTTAPLDLERQSAWGFTRRSIGRGLVISLVGSALWLLATPSLATFFNLASPLPLVVFTPIFSAGIIAAGYRGLLQGRLSFHLVGVVVVAEAFSKLGLAVLFIGLGQAQWTYVAIPASIICTVPVAWLLARHLRSSQSPLASSASLAPLASVETPPFSIKFYFGSVFAAAAAVIFLSLDIILVKHYLSPTMAGEYAILSLVGKMMFFFVSLPNVFTMSYVSLLHGRHERSNHIFNWVIAATVTLAACAWVGLGYFGSSILPIILGAKVIPLLPLLTQYLIAIGLFNLSAVYVSYHLGRRQYLYPLLSLTLSLSLAVGIGWYHQSLEQIVAVIFTVSAVQCSLLSFFHLFDSARVAVGRNGFNFWHALFDPLPGVQRWVTGQKIIMFNWRDTQHAYAGGAELYVHEMAKRWVKHGHAVTVFCGNDGHHKTTEVIDGVQIVRCGGFYLVYFWAALLYLLRYHRYADSIIDCQNGIPFFTPLYSHKPIYCLMHHVHQEVFRTGLNAPMAWLGRTLENKVMPVVYARTPFITISQSSKREMEKLGLGQAGIEIVHPGVNLQSLFPGKKSERPSVVYLGRLKAYKSVDILIQAFKLVVAKVPQAELIIAGDGEEGGNLRRLVERFGLTDSVRFAGRVTEQQKQSLLQRAWVFVNPSLMEGWGITTIEANACATPVVAANVPGLCDSVVNPHTGYLVEHGNVPAFADKIVLLITDTRLRAQMMTDAVAWAGRFDWNITSTLFLNIIEQGYQRMTIRRRITASVRRFISFLFF